MFLILAISLLMFLDNRFSHRIIDVNLVDSTNSKLGQKTKITRKAGVLQKCLSYRSGIMANKIKDQSKSSKRKKELLTSS